MGQWGHKLNDMNGLVSGPAELCVEQGGGRRKLETNQNCCWPGHCMPETWQNEKQTLQAFMASTMTKTRMQALTPREPLNRKETLAMLFLTVAF